MTEQTCDTCAYARGYGQYIECRIKPPSPNYKSYGRMFPIVQSYDWCGRYKEKDGTTSTPEWKDDFDE